MLVNAHPSATQQRKKSSKRYTGESYPVKFGRMGFRKTFEYDRIWRGRRYANKEVEAIAVKISEGWLVLTVITRFF